MARYTCVGCGQPTGWRRSKGQPPESTEGLCKACRDIDEAAVTAGAQPPSASRSKGKGKQAAPAPVLAIVHEGTEYRIWQPGEDS